MPSASCKRDKPTLITWRCCSRVPAPAHRRRSYFKGRCRLSPRLHQIGQLLDYYRAVYGEREQSGPGAWAQDPAPGPLLASSSQQGKARKEPRCFGVMAQDTVELHS